MGRMRRAQRVARLAFERGLPDCLSRSASFRKPREPRTVSKRMARTAHCVRTLLQTTKRWLAFEFEAAPFETADASSARRAFALPAAQGN